jgi:hypothetical protein
MRAFDSEAALLSCARRARREVLSAMTNSPQRVISFDRVRMADVDQVGGKNASLGEMIGELNGAAFAFPAALRRPRSRSRVRRD